MGQLHPVPVGPTWVDNGPNQPLQGRRRRRDSRAVRLGAATSFVEVERDQRQRRFLLTDL